MNKTKRKIAFDIHGVLDTFDYFVDLLRTHYSVGDEVYIITGQKYDDQIKRLFEEKGIEGYYHRYFSILQHLEDKGVQIEWKEGGGFADDNEWNVVKRDICKAHNVDIIYDDSPIYRDTFDEIDTLFVHVVNSKRKNYREQNK